MKYNWGLFGGVVADAQATQASLSVGSAEPAAAAAGAPDASLTASDSSPDLFDSIVGSTMDVETAFGGDMTPATVKLEKFDVRDSRSRSRSPRGESMKPGDSGCWAVSSSDSGDESGHDTHGEAAAAAAALERGGSHDSGSTSSSSCADDSENDSAGPPGLVRSGSEASDTNSESAAAQPWGVSDSDCDSDGPPGLVRDRSAE